MNEMNIDWNDLSLFLAVAREGGLSAAARKTGKSPATLGRRMLALERHLSKELFIRHDRGYELTPHGKNLLADLNPIEAGIRRATLSKKQKKLPVVKISAGTWTTHVLLENLEQITGSPPDVSLRFIATEEILDIPHREVAIGFRSQRPTETALAGRKLTNITFAVYATKTAPQKWIKVISPAPSARWVESTAGNNIVCDVNSPRHSLDLALAGKGLAVFPTFIGDKKPALRRVGEIIPELTHDRWIVTHQDDRFLPEVRRTINRLVKVLAT